MSDPSSAGRGKGTSVRLLRNGAEAFPAMLDAIGRASSSIALEMYIFADDGTGREFRSRLAAAAKRGLEVRVLVDALGSWQLSSAFWSEVTAAGGSVRMFRPFSRGVFLLRNHRKLLLVDDRTAFLGGLNISDEYGGGRAGQPPWRDNALEISGEEVPGLRRSFGRMWELADQPLGSAVLSMGRTGRDSGLSEGRVQFLESGPGDAVQKVRRAYSALIGAASRRIDLSMSYFYPSGAVLRALGRAVRRGVPVRVLLSRTSDVAIARWAARGLYGRLLRTGIEVWEYRPSVLHAKLAIVDDTVVAGSANLDIRSGRINHELVAVVRDASFAGLAWRDFERDLDLADRITMADWMARPAIQRFLERVSAWLLARLDMFLARAEIARIRR